VKASPLKTVPLRVAVIGAGPAGLMAAEQIALAGHLVDVYDAMPSAGRKFLLAGKGGMNLTHSEGKDQFLERYRERKDQISPILDVFDAQGICLWAKSLGIETFVGSSGRVFPVDMKAAPLLRAWLHRIRSLGVKFHMRHRWLGWAEDGKLLFSTEATTCYDKPDAMVFAMGGASWRRLGSDGQWAVQFNAKGIDVAPFAPANCGFNVHWSEFFRSKFSGTPLKTVNLIVNTITGVNVAKQGQFVIAEYGVEGSLIYALSAEIRNRIAEYGHAMVFLDLLPGKSLARVFDELRSPRGARSLSSHLQSKLGLQPIHTALVYECLKKDQINDISTLAKSLKELPIRIASARPIDEAISSAGGVKFAGLDENLMLTAHQGYFCAGEMLDWEAPTGGYLLTGCFATGFVAGRGVVKWLKNKNE
jgi:uncharacterized flavoprotein (TIGR03862 family)